MNIQECEILYHVEMSVDKLHEPELARTGQMSARIVRDHLPEFKDRKNLSLVLCLIDKGAD
jgi:hypothetical protein